MLKVRVMLVVMLTLLLILSVNPTASQNNLSIGYESYSFTSDDYTEHIPISIVGNDDFLNQAAIEDWSGSGTREDPIIITGLLIRASAHMFRVIDTDIFFELRDNILNGVDQSWCGLYIANASNGAVVNNTIYNAAIGVHVLRINNTIFSENVVFDNSYEAIAFEGACHQNNVTNNVFFDNYLGGVWVDWFSTNNLIFNNTIKNNFGPGVYLLEDSSQNQVLNNTIFHNHGGVVVKGIRNIIGNNSIISNFQDGVLISFGENMIVGNCIWNNSQSGIKLYTFNSENNDNIISNNSILTNDDYGVTIGSSCNYNTITANNFISNGESLQAYDDGEGNNFEYNYWNPWTNVDEDLDGYVDTSYSIDGTVNNTDDNPRVNPYEHALPAEFEFLPNLAPTTPEANSLDLQLPVLLIAVGVGGAIVVFLFKKRK